MRIEAIDVSPVDKDCDICYNNLLCVQIFKNGFNYLLQISGGYTKWKKKNQLTWKV